MKTRSGQRAALKRSKVFELVVKELRQRDRQGFEQWEMPIEHATIDALGEAYEEALDLAVYLRRVLFDRDGK